MWAPFFEFPWEQAPHTTGSTGGIGGGGSTGSTAPVVFELGSNEAIATGTTAAEARRLEAQQLQSNAAAKTAGPKAASGVGGAQAGSGASSKSCPPGQGVQARKTPAFPELRPGKVGIGNRAEGVQVRGLRITGGVGRCLATEPIVQDRAFWEVHVVDVAADLGARLLVGTGINIGTGDILLQDLGVTPQSYGVQFGAGGEAPLKVGDVIGVSFDQAVFPVAVTVWLNGSLVAAPMSRGLRGEQWPALYVSSCTVDWGLDEAHWKFAKTCPEGFSALMPCRSLIGD
eukprot:TRINITY_DN11717_c0_g1_i1.p1 TRINITY_DN11717_c0_g1~~TRINITY_DN11717_c0_g1_i1.p1  ORF type:complete len:286 (+),score=53.61 TRINITY_DN11717_c0_g1_i1:71-928(+)